MEDQGHTPNQRDDTSRELLGEAGFKLPQAYVKLKKRISQASEFSFLAGFLNEKTSESKNIVEFCRHLLSHKDFQSFRTIHFFKHEKGQSFALKYEIGPDISNEKDFHVNEFNLLFQAIKKSKNRTFGQDSLKGFNFDILGTFLAREFALGNHNIILIISRNDFLNQTKEEKAAFSKLTKVISPYFNIILNKELQIQHFKHICLAYENLPYKVHIFKETTAGARPLPSGKYFKLEMDEILDKADIFHQERIALLGELLNTLKHELSNPLFGLQLSAELLTMDFQDDEHVQFMQEIGSSIKRSQSIISNFTELYTSSERLTPDDLEKLVHEVFTLTKSQSRHIHKTYEVVRDDGAKDFVVQANSVWLAQILFNLVVNSAQALNLSNNKAPTIHVKAFLQNPFELHVIDNGPGAPAQTIENMFKPFYTTKEKGTGLGLAISQSLANKLNGQIEYLSEGQGAHFILRLGS